MTKGNAVTLLFQNDPAAIEISEGRSPLAIIILLAASQYDILAVSTANLLGAAKRPVCSRQYSRPKQFGGRDACVE